MNDLLKFLIAMAPILIGSQIFCIVMGSWWVLPLAVAIAALIIGWIIFVSEVIE